MTKGKILAIDYGGAAIGLAVSDIDRQMAFGRGVLRKMTLEQIFQKIMELVEDESIVLILIGLPLGKEGEETKQTEKIRAFAEKMSNFLTENGLNIDIDYIDESFSTFEAGNILKELGVKGRDRKTTEDEMAAIILVHRYIDFRP
jgi:putative pre-16S rRNA nuclease